jgi:hypothetical protein
MWFLESDGNSVESSLPNLSLFQPNESNVLLAFYLSLCMNEEQNKCESREKLVVGSCSPWNSNGSLIYFIITQLFCVKPLSVCPFYFIRLSSIYWRSWWYMTISGTCTCITWCTPEFYKKYKSQWSSPLTNNYEFSEGFVLLRGFGELYFPSTGYFTGILHIATTTLKYQSDYLIKALWPDTRLPGSTRAPFYSPFCVFCYGMIKPSSTSPYLLCPSLTNFPPHVEHEHWIGALIMWNVEMLNMNFEWEHWKGQNFECEHEHCTSKVKWQMWKHELWMGGTLNMNITHAHWTSDGMLNMNMECWTWTWNITHEHWTKNNIKSQMTNVKN